MEPLVVGLCMCLLVQVAQQSPMLDVETRRANRKKAHSFIEDKLIEHGQALELILKSVQKNEDLTKRLLDNMSLRISPPKLPQRIEGPVLTSGRRAYEQAALHPELMKVGVARPMALVTEKPSGYAPREVDPWCRNAALCKATGKDPVCGFDDSFGLGKFDNICHMVYVNCYWKHDFTLVNCNQNAQV
ncbi:uncharacterized protein LOC128678344 isoform X2 [Plodia interpunctella]|uniref:uncharacterized protein LOC128678344 isoform X2 n=1 Tax=Plodia interpunctella TaxID=58824 RepID=UPI002367A77F|nr:uncharacterized protein LOC128678344 isoform X2 [Plodia interpunctella]